jgi:hypothetical protein
VLPYVLTWSGDVRCSTDESGARSGGSAVGTLWGDVRLFVMPFIPTANVVSRECATFSPVSSNVSTAT